ncbi:MAG: hypothetical protein KDA61_17665 [Planctomycetales bacterium]|nr:hypothetical protein [Planctomycetales bacterium]
MPLDTRRYRCGEQAAWTVENSQTAVSKALMSDFVAPRCRVIDARGEAA